MKKQIEKISQMLSLHYGMNVSMYDESFFILTVQRRIKDLKCNSTDDYYQLLQNNPAEIVELSDSLHVCYSEFFRNKLTFSVLSKLILPSIEIMITNSGRKEIRIWSAACASGQEPYSMAMLLKEHKNTKGKEINYRIFATDISELQISQAKEGLYSIEALSDLTIKGVNQWFTKKAEMYIVKNELRKNIDFSVFDLFNEQTNCPNASIFGDFDIVVCANVLFYYKPEFQKKILDKLRKSLADNGLIITGETEREILMNNNFKEVFPQSAIFQK